MLITLTERAELVQMGTVTLFVGARKPVRAERWDYPLCKCSTALSYVLRTHVPNSRQEVGEARTRTIRPQRSKIRLFLGLPVLRQGSHRVTERNGAFGSLAALKLCQFRQLSTFGRLVTQRLVSVSDWIRSCKSFLSSVGVIDPACLLLLSTSLPVDLWHLQSIIIALFNLSRLDSINLRAKEV